MPTTSLGLPYPASTGHTRLWEHIQTLADTVDALLTMPDALTDYGAGLNTVTATSWLDLPSFAPSVVFTNPSSAWDLEVEVSYAAWLLVSAGDVRATVIATGGLSIPAGIGTGGATGWGEVLYTATAGVQCSSSYTCVIPAGASAVTFKFQAYRQSAGTQQVNYPTIRVRPTRYLAP